MTEYTLWNNINSSSVINYNDKLLLNGNKLVTANSLNEFISPLKVNPSGDETGITDRIAIQTVIDTYGSVKLDVGTFYTDVTITLDGKYESIEGSGRKTKIIPNAGINAITIFEEDFNVVSNLMISGGAIGVVVDAARQCVISNVQIDSNTSDGIKFQNGVWQVVIQGCELYSCDGNGINAVSIIGSNNGNALAIHGCQIEACDESGIVFGAFGMSVLGCTIQGNGVNSGAGILLDTSSASSTGVVIEGNFFESNGAIAGIEIRTDMSAAFAAVGLRIAGNHFNEDANTPCVFASGNGAGRVRSMYIDDTNYITGSANVVKYQFGSNVRNSIILGISRANQNLNYAYESQNLFISMEASPVVTETFTVACNEDKTGQIVDLIILRKGSTILEITTKCVEVMDGSITTTFEVGNVGNADNYIDLVDFDPSTLGSVQGMTWGGVNDQVTSELIVDAFEYIRCVWTNTGGVPSTGSVEVRITYSQASTVNNVVAVP